MSIAVYTHADMLDHNPGNEERPARLKAVTDALSDASDLDLELHDAPQADVRDLQLVHPEGYVEAIFSAHPGAGLIALDEVQETLMSAGSLNAARRAAGAVIAAVRDVAAGETERAFCAVRPPGHHMSADHPLGFCIFSNIALGAAAARLAGYGKVAVVDFDVHHGNGTQALFETDPSLFFASIHQLPCWPGTGRASETGIGNVVNVPVAPYADRSVWRGGFERLMERVDAFAPDIILVSAGFDAHARDPIAQQELEAEDYGWATRAIVSVANRRAGGRVVSTLEGGYDLEALGQSALAHVRALQGG